MTTITWHIGDSAAPLPPKAPGLPVLGSALNLRRDPARYITRLYQQLGPIFRVQILNREVYFLAGLEANKFTSQHDEEVFTNEIEFGGLMREVGPLFTGAPPAEHAYLRRLAKPAYARSLALNNTAVLVEVVEAFLDRLRPGDRFEVFPTLQELVVTQLGRVLLGQAPGEYFDDLRTFMRSMLEVYQFRMKPRWTLALPGYQRAKRRAFEMARRVLAHHRAQPPSATPRNELDIYLNAVDARGQPFGEATLLGAALGPYLAGQDTVAGTLAFIAYTVHKHPAVRDRIEAEVRAGFAGGVPAGEAFRRFETLHKTIHETMRRYPVAVFMPRHAARAFTFAGYRVPAGAPVYCATSVVHFLPEYYPDPDAFDIERPRGPAGTFAPYGVGNYTCLGAGMADVQLMVTMAALLNRARFELDPPDYTATLDAIPLPNPGRFFLRLVARHPR